MMQLLLDSFSNYSVQGNSTQMRIGLMYKPQFRQDISSLNTRERDFLRRVAWGKHKVPSSPGFQDTNINSVVVDLNRGVSNFAENSDALMTDLNKQTTGLTINFENAGQLSLTTQPFIETAELIQVPLTADLFSYIYYYTLFKPKTYLYVEHCRYLMMKRDENFVLR